MPTIECIYNLILVQLGWSWATFLIVVIITLGLTFFSAYYNRFGSKLLKQQKLKLEEKSEKLSYQLMEKSMELSKVEEKLFSTQDQLIQSEKWLRLASLLPALPMKFKIL